MKTGATALLLHAIRMLWTNRKEALRIVWLPVLITLLANAALSGSILGPVAAGEAGWSATSTLAILSIFVPLIGLAMMLWMAVAWHRFVLLEEHPTGLAPAFRVRRMLAYLGRAILLGLIALLPLLPIVFLGAALASDASAAMILILPVALVVSVISLRLGTILPAAAIGEPLGLGGAWRATRGTIVTILTISVLTLAVSFASGFLGTLLTAMSPLIGLLSMITLNFLITLFGLSLLTTFYGHFVEGRPLAS